MSANTNDPAGFISLDSYPQAIVHIDCDAFFTACEKARDPSLKGLPVATGKERGIVSCPSYEAKALGVVRGMRLGDAKKACPKLVTLPSDYELYSIYSERLFAILRRFTPQVEEYSIDEAFCDLAGLRRFYRAPYPEIALAMKRSVQKELDITVSAGLSLSKTLAKICSKENKPDGFTAVPGRKLHEFLAGIELRRVCGFGPSSVALLNKLGIRTVLDYVKRDIALADKLLGKIGRELWQELRGISIYRVSDQPKERYLSISKTKTFSPSSSDRDDVKAHLIRNLESAFIKLRRHRLSARSISIFLKRNDFSGTGLEARATRHSASTLDFAPICSALFDRAFEPGTRYRATGVTLCDIKDDARAVPDLFDDPVAIEKTRILGEVIDDINASYGKHTLHLASSQAASKRSRHARNEPAWRKTALLKGETFRQRLRIPLIRTAKP